MVPFLDLGAAYRELASDIDAAIGRVLRSGSFILGEEVAEFESEFAGYCAASHCVGVANGLDALVLALRALDVGAGDEVIVPSNTFIATWLAVSAVGAVPVPVEPDAATYNIDPKLVQDAITSRTKAIIAVHLYGQPADLDSLVGIARANGIYLIEDAAQAQGARYRNERIGARSDAVCWSFYPAKNLGAMGDAGAVTTSNAEISERIRLMRNYGSREKYRNEVKGVNSRLDPLQAAVLRVKLRHLDDWNARRSAIARDYVEGLAGTDIVLPLVPEWAQPTWHLFVIRTGQRDALQRRLLEGGVMTHIHYPIPPSRQPAYEQEFGCRRPLPIAERLAGEVLSLPIGPHQAREQTLRVIDVIRGN